MRILYNKLKKEYVPLVFNDIDTDEIIAEKFEHWLEVGDNDMKVNTDEMMFYDNWNVGSDFENIITLLIDYDFCGQQSVKGYDFSIETLELV